MTLRKLSFVALAFLLVASLGMAQSKDTGTFVGSVLDVEGAPLPGVTVTAKNLDMGLVQSTVTNDSGFYRIEKLPRGMYTLTAAIQGFKTTTREGLELVIGAEIKVNFNLEIGKLEENITVIGVSPLVETTRAQVSTVITEKEFMSYPQGNRDYTSLIGYAPGTNPDTSGRSGYAINGMRGSSNNFQIDGIDNNDNGTASSAVTSMPPESIQEFRLVSNNFSAEYGRNSGGVINAVMKSGTNELHGNAWFFYRGGSALFQTEDWLTHDLPPYKRYQYGGTIGGPIKKDKTFFFASFEGVAQDDEARTPYYFFTPEAIARSQGSAREYFDKYGADYPVPTSNFIDVDGDGLIDAGQYVWNGTAKTRGYNFGIKIDHIFSEKDRVAFRWLFNTYKYQWDFDNVPGQIKKNPYSYHTGGLTWLHLFSPTMYNEVRIGYHRDYADWPRVAPEIPQLGGYTYFSDNVHSIGDWGNMPQKFANNTYQLVDVLNFQVGNHSIKLGGEARLWNSESTFDANVAGNYYFIDSTWFLYDLGAYYLYMGVDPPDPPEGNPYALGPANQEFKIGNTHRKWQGLEGGLFIQDDWRVTDKLTLSLGLRWEYYGVPTEKSGVGINMPAAGTQAGHDSLQVIEGTYSEEGIRNLIFDGRQLLGKGLWNPYYKAFAPKISFAYDLTGDGKTSLRAGAGVSYDRTFNNTYENDRFNYPDFTFVGIGGWDAFYPYSVGYPAIHPTFPGSIPQENIQAGGYRVSLRWMMPNLIPQKAYNWLVGIQRELSPNVSIEINYTGSKGRNLGSIQRPNRFTGDRLDGVSNLINPLIAATGLNARIQNLKSDYHAFTATINKRFSNGWSWYTAYTYGVAKDQDSDYFGEDPTTLGAVSNERIGDEYGYAQFDRRHRVVGGMIFDIPFFKNSKNWFLKNVVAGWQISSNFHFTTGAPFTIRANASSVDWNQDYNSNDRPIWLGGNSYQDIITWTDGRPGWDRSLFGIPTLPSGARDMNYYNQNFVPRMAFRWFPTHNINISLQKYWTVTVAGREVTLQGIFEVFNVLKAYFWDLPSFNWTAADFGVSHRMSGQRTSQVSVRIMF
jgi:outer membrane receptor protein involved in Fe transport